MSTANLFSSRLIVVMGKGGVGRSSVTAALALAAVRTGKRTLIVEMGGGRDVAQYIGLDGRSYQPRPWRDGVDVSSITAAECLEDFGQRKLRTGALLRRVLNNRVSRAFLEAVPGLHDLLQLGKIENLLCEPLPRDTHYDLVILDAPATGHGLTLLSAARTMADLTRIGPFHDLAQVIATFLSDRQRTALVLVTLPEALPVQESLELHQSLHDDGAGLAAVIINRVQPERIPARSEWPAVLDALRKAGSPWTEAAPELHDWVQSSQGQNEIATRLKEAVEPTPLLTLYEHPTHHHETRLESMATDLVEGT